MQTPMKLLPLLRSSRLAFPLAALAALGMFLISESSYRQASTTIVTLGEQSTARTKVQDLRRALTDAETGQRGFLLTGRRGYLRPYEEATQEAGGLLVDLRRYYNRDPDAGGLMQEIQTNAERKLRELATTIRLHDAGDTAGWQRVLATDDGERTMDRVRALSEQLFDQELAKAVEERKSLHETLLLNRIGVSTLTGLCLLALYMYLRQTSELVRQREERRQQVQIERDQLEHEAMQRTAQLTELTRHLQSVREDERHRLARELHDELGALLTAAKLDVARLKSRLGAVTPEVAERLQHLSDGLNSGIALKRRIIEDLRPSSLSNLGLVAALDILVREWSQRNELAVRSQFEPVQLTDSGELTVYRLVQEALTNISKYARASEVRLLLESSGGEVHVAVVDDGIGFDAGTPRASAHGLLGMRYRLESEGGRLQITSAAGRGTTVEAFLPERQKTAAAPDPDADSVPVAIADLPA